MGIKISNGEKGYSFKLKTPNDNYFDNPTADLANEESFIYNENDDIDSDLFPLFFLQKNGTDVEFKYLRKNINSIDTIAGLRVVPEISDKKIRLSSTTQDTLYKLLKEGY